MTSIILRRRNLGRGSAKGIMAASNEDLMQGRNWRRKDWRGLDDSNVSYVFRWGCTSNLPFPAHSC